MTAIDVRETDIAHAPVPAAQPATPPASKASTGPVLSARKFVERQRSRSALAQFLVVATVISAGGLWLSGLLAHSWTMLVVAGSLSVFSLAALLAIRSREGAHSPLVRHHTASAFNAIVFFTALTLIGLGGVTLAARYAGSDAAAAPLDAYDFTRVAWVMVIVGWALISSVRAFVAATGGQPFRYLLAPTILK